MSKFDSDAIVAYDMERTHPAAPDIHVLIHSIGNKPHFAPVYITQALEEQVELRTESLRAEVERLNSEIDRLRLPEHDGTQALRSPLSSSRRAAGIGMGSRDLGLDLNQINAMIDHAYRAFISFMSPNRMAEEAADAAYCLHSNATPPDDKEWHVERCKQLFRACLERGQMDVFHRSFARGKDGAVAGWGGPVAHVPFSGREYRPDIDFSDVVEWLIDGRITTQSLSAYWDADELARMAMASIDISSVTDDSLEVLEVALLLTRECKLDLAERLMERMDNVLDFLDKTDDEERDGISAQHDTTCQCPVEFEPEEDEWDFDPERPASSECPVEFEPEEGEWDYESEEDQP